MRHQSPDGIEEMGIGDGASGEKQSRPPHCPTSVLLCVLVLVLNLLVDNTEGGEEVAQEEDEEGEAAHEDLWEERPESAGRTCLGLPPSQGIPRSLLTCHSLHSGCCSMRNRVMAL